MTASTITTLVPNVLHKEKINSPTSNGGSLMQVVLIKGKEGSGRTSVTTWLRKQVLDRQLFLAAVKVGKKDGTTDYSIWRKVFLQLMPKDLFQSNDRQRHLVRATLREVYQSDVYTAEHVAFPVMKEVLGITCSYSDQTPFSAHGAHGGHAFGHALASFDENDHWGGRGVQLRTGWFTSIKRQGSAHLNKDVSKSETLLRIFTHLMNKNITLLIIENIEHSDEESLRLLMDLCQINSRSAIVITALMMDESAKSLVGSMMNSMQSNSKSINHDALYSTAWNRSYREKVQKLRMCNTLILENFTPEEIDKMLAAALGVKVVPPEISQLVQDFSGGSYFWVHEIVQFIKEHGPALFMNAIGESAEGPGKDGIEGSHQTNATSSTALSSKSSFHTAHSHSSYTLRAGQEDGASPARNKPKPRSLTTPTSGGSNGGANPNSQGGTPNRASSMRQLNSSASFRQHRNSTVRNTFSQVKLDKLILCRFENLHADVQHVLRTASIIGTTFTSHVLYGVLPRRLKDEMSNCLKCLLNARWLYQDVDNESLFQFAHPHAHQVIYELTPSSERNNTHETIGRYIEETYGPDRSNFATLTYHFQHNNTDKALRYAVLAASIMLESEVIFDYGDCVDMLQSCYACCKTHYDIDVLLKLVITAKNCIEKLNVKKRKGGNLFSFLGRLASCFQGRGGSGKYKSKNSSVHPSVKDTSNHSVGDSEKFSDSVSDDTVQDNSDPEETNYERHTKKVLLHQIDDLNDKLCEKYVDLVDSDEAEAKEWQKHVLGLHSAKMSTAGVTGNGNGLILNESVLTSLLRNFSGDDEEHKSPGVHTRVIRVHAHQ